jgi:hypothetical protein
MSDAMSLPENNGLRHSYTVLWDAGGGKVHGHRAPHSGAVTVLIFGATTARRQWASLEFLFSPATQTVKVLSTVRFGLACEGDGIHDSLLEYRAQKKAYRSIDQFLTATVGANLPMGVRRCW